MACTANWYDAYPQPRTTTPKAITAESLLKQLKSGATPGVEFLLIDVRRNDHEGGTIRNSLNLPAQSLYQSLPTLLQICVALQPRLKQVIWYCGSSRGRGTRAAGWFNDLLEDKAVEGIESAILEGGIKGWVQSGNSYIQWMEGYDSLAWKT